MALKAVLAGEAGPGKLLRIDGSSFMPCNGRELEGLPVVLD
jgi:hypothetical protein